MNIVDMLKEQMMGEAGKKLGSMIGAKDSEMGKILGAAIPSVLSGFGAMASSKGGADKLAKTIGGMDSSTFGDLGKMLGSSAMNGGGGMLGGLLGGGVVDGIANVISKFTGINVTTVKTALGYLAPMVLGSIAASLKVTKPDGAGIAKLFSEQKDNISAAMPAGLSLGSIPGFPSLESNVVRTAKESASDVGSGLGQLIIPGAVIVALIAAGVFFLNNEKKGIDAVKDKAAETNRAATGLLQESSSMVNAAADARTDAVKSSVNGVMDGLMKSLDGIQDSAAAEAAMPALKEMVSQVDGLSLSIRALPDEQRSMIGVLIKSQLEKLNPAIEKISALPGVGDSIKTLLLQLKDMLTSLIS